MDLRPGRADLVDEAGDEGHFLVGGGVGQVAEGRPVGVDEEFRPGAGLAPEVLGDEGHEGVKEDHRLIQHPGHGGPGFRGMLSVEERFGEFHVPVADLAPDEFVERVGGEVEAELGQCLLHLGRRAGGLADDPAVGGGFRRGRGALGRVTLPDAVHLGKAAGVPELGAEIPVSRNALRVELQHATERGHGRIGKAQGIGAVFVDDLQRVDDVAQGLGHLLALGVADEAMEIDGVEGDILDHGKLHHHHPGDPEEDDVEAGDQHGGREILLQLRRLFRPAQRPDGPETGGEPGVQHVGIAPDGIDQLGRVLRNVVFGQGCRQSGDGFRPVGDLDHAGVVQRMGQGCQRVEEGLRDGSEARRALRLGLALGIAAIAEDAQDLDLVQRLVALVVAELLGLDGEAIPDRDLVAPPELPGDAPGFDVFEPVEIGLLARLRHDLGPA